MLKLNDGRSELWQWDTGRKLTVDADCSQVHFSNKVFGRSIDVDVIDGVAIIPDILLQTDKDLNVWAFVGTAENGYTKISKTFKVNRRNKPSDYVFTPPEQTSLEEIKKEIEYLKSIQDPDAIKNAVDDYLANNPIKVNETDPTVSNWAKEKEKPKYTADEVGALSKTELSGAVNDALAQAKDSGEFDGEPGEPGSDYVLTEADKQEIAELTAPLVDVPEGGSNQPLTFTGAVNVTYDGSEAVSVEIPEGGESGEARIYAEEQLATGIISSDSAGQKLNGVFETGLTLGDLKKWKSFMCKIRGNSNTDAGTFYLRLMNTNYGNDYNAISLFRSNTSGALAVFEWANSDKTVLKLVSGCMGGKGSFVEVGEYFASSSSSTWTILPVSSSIGSWVDLRNCVDTQVLAVTKLPAATDYLWEIRGLIK